MVTLGFSSTMQLQLQSRCIVYLFLHAEAVCSARFLKVNKQTGDTGILVYVPTIWETGISQDLLNFLRMHNFKSQTISLPNRAETGFTSTKSGGFVLTCKNLFGHSMVLTASFILGVIELNTNSTCSAQFLFTLRQRDE